DPARGGCTRPGRDPVGDDPVRGVPLRALGSRLRRDARSRPRTRRDDGGGDDPRDHSPDHPQRRRHGQPTDDRGQHRTELQGVHTGAAVAADRHWPCALRRDVPGELHRPLGHRSPGSEPGAMSSNAMRISHPRLPVWAPGLVVVVALALAGLPALLSGWSVVQVLLAATLVFLIAMPSWSRFVEGRRAAIDRLVTALVWVSFACAMAPLVWLLWVVIKNGLPAINWDFLSSSMQNVIGDEQGG